MQPVAILAAGMVTGVGLNATASCAAIRCAIDNFSETRFMDKGGKWIIGSEVVLEQPWRGLKKVVHMVVPAIRECLAQTEAVNPESIPLLLCVAEKQRSGRLEGLDDQLFDEVQKELGVRFHARSTVLAQGRVGGALALRLARSLIHELPGNERVPFCIIAGGDSLLTATTLAAYEEQARLLTSQNSNGFIPGEAGGAILVGSASPSLMSPILLCYGIGFGQEKATVDSEEPLRADGLVQAFKAAFADAQRGFERVDYRLTDANGEQYLGKEAALAMTRTMRVRKEPFEIWQPADCIGEIGSATVPCAISVVLTAAQKKYAPGQGVLCHFSNDDGQRLALVLGVGDRCNN